MVYQSESIKHLATAVLGVQSELEGVSRDSQGYGYKYADLQACYDASRPITVKYGLAITQTGRVREGKNLLVTTVMHAESGEWQSGEVIISPEEEKDPQSFGSTMTYLRRYYYCAAIGLTQTDDDGASGKKRPNQPNKQAPSKEAPRSQGSTPAKSQVSVAIDKLKATVAQPRASEVEEPEWLREPMPFDGEPAKVLSTVKAMRNLAAGSWEFPGGKYSGQKLSAVELPHLKSYHEFLIKPGVEPKGWVKTFDEQYRKFMGE